MKENKKQEERKEVSFISVINVIAGIIVAIFGVISLLAALILSSPIFYVPTFLFFAFAVFLFLPQKVIRMSKWLKLLIAVIGFFISLIILGALGTNIPRAQASFEEHPLNEAFIITYNKVNFSMVIYNSTQTDKMIVDGQEKTTSGIFLLVHGSATNNGNYASILSFSSGLMDNQNKSYSLHSANMESGEIQPGLSRNFFVVFEIPKSASGLKFLVADQTKVVRRITLER
jgi:hypothetical protein